MDDRDDSETVSKNPLQMVREYASASADGDLDSNDAPDQPLISNEVDALVDVIESAGGSWHVMGGSKIVPPYVAFQMPGDIIYSASLRAFDAMRVFDKLFRSSAEVREVTIEHAMSIGCYFVELHNAAPVVSIGSTNQ